MDIKQFAINLALRNGHVIQEPVTASMSRDWWDFYYGLAKYIAKLLIDARIEEIKGHPSYKRSAYLQERIATLQKQKEEL